MRVRHLLVFVLFVFNMNEVSMANESIGRINTDLLKAIVKVDTPNNHFGTAFIVSKAVPNAKDRRFFFLVTNKHLLGDYNTIKGAVDSYFDFVTISVYKKDKSIQKVRISLKNKDGSLNVDKVFPYDNSYIDLAIVSIGDDLESIIEIDKVSFDISYLTTDKILENWNIDIGDQIFALGYPQGIYSKSNYYPIAKSGYISSKVGEELIVTAQYLDITSNQVVGVDVKGKIILLDGTLVGGNSGGPIIVPAGVRARTKIGSNQVEFSDKGIDNLIIGIQSQSYTDAGISIAFSSEYILELINKITP